MEKIQMVDLKSQYEKIKPSIDAAIQKVIDTTAFINGPQVASFGSDLASYLSVNHVIPCANGTDALQIALMALELEKGDEVIVPAFTYVATAEVIALLGLKPVLAEVDPETFNITSDIIEPLITSRTKVIVPVHLYGQCCDMESILILAKKYSLFVIEDTAQALGAEYTFSNGTVKKAGTIGDIGCTSFFPSKNLGCYGDGGAVYCNDEKLAARIKMIANHGQEKKYYHKVIGCNSRLDTIQAAILQVKLKELDKYADARNEVATSYDQAFKSLDWITVPKRASNSTHVFHQYTIKLQNSQTRDELKRFLEVKGIPSMIYYPLPLHLQEAFRTPELTKGSFPVSEDLCDKVLSLPIHTEMKKDALDYIVDIISSFQALSNN